MIVACIQFASIFGDLDTNCDRAVSLCEEAARDGIRAVIKPGGSKVMPALIDWARDGVLRRGERRLGEGAEPTQNP